MWSRTYGGTDEDMAFSLVATSDGGYAIAGCIYSDMSFEGDFYIASDFWLVKLDSAGNIEWNKTYGNPENAYERAYSVVETADGGYAMAGLAGTWPIGSLYLPGNTNIWLVKTDASGNMQWNKTYNGGSEARSLVQASDGGYAMAGYIITGSYGSSCLVKTDALGNLQWTREYVMSGGSRAYAVVATSDGGYTIAGTANDDYWLAKTDALGNRQWNKTYGGAFSEQANALVVAPDGGYAMTGYSQLTGSTDFWLVKTDAAGNMEWNKTYGNPETSVEIANSIVAVSDGGYALAGEFGFASGPGGEFGLIKTDAMGNMEWNQTDGSGLARSLVEAADGGYAIAGYITSDYQYDCLVVKTDELGFVPEYASLLIPALVLTATALIIINKKRLLRKHSQEP